MTSSLPRKQKSKDHVLYVSKKELSEVFLSEEKIKEVEFDVARPGESVRITPVKDVIEPRVKVEGKGGVFPGVISSVETVGSGKTYCLKGDGCSYCRTYRWFPGRNHRHDRSWRRVHPVLEDSQLNLCM